MLLEGHHKRGDQLDRNIPIGEKQMKIVVSAGGAGMDAAASPLFGRCPTYVVVDTERMDAESVDNPAVSAAGGAGIQAAQFLIQEGVEAVLSGNLGPNASQVFDAADIGVYLHQEQTVRQAVEAFKAGALSASGANVAAHTGTGMSLRRGTGRGLGRRTSAPVAPPAPAEPTREERVAELEKEAAELRKRMVEIGSKLDALDKGGN
jgi:predicted Fe-Mo cluster-binding NifX family protein